MATREAPLAEEKITHAQALDLIEEHLGENVYVGFHFSPANDPAGKMGFVHAVVGELSNALEPRPPRLDPEVGYYQIGTDAYGFSPIAGAVYLRDNGIDFRAADTALIRVAWRGSSEVGDWRPTRESLAKLNSVGIKLPEHEKPGVTLPSEPAE